MSTHLDPTRSADPVVELSAALGPRYRLERPLAPGGTTTAWLAHAVDGGDPVVVKVSCRSSPPGPTPSGS